jgi:ABC-type antimicrobial peptide transport system permease subunit
MAIGAQRGDILRLVLREGLTTAGLGVVLGLIGALLASQLLKTMLFGVSATNPFIFGINALVLMVVALAACFIPPPGRALDPMKHWGSKP